MRQHTFIRFACCIVWRGIFIFVLQFKYSILLSSISTKSYDVQLFRIDIMQLRWRNISGVLNVSTMNWLPLRELKYIAGRGTSVGVCSLSIRLNIKLERERQHAFQDSSYCLLNRICKISTMTTVNTFSRSFNWRAGKPPGRMDKDVLLLIDGITCSLIASWSGVYPWRP
jgi:hypothetical protein